MTAVIYARYSSDSQREASIEGQLRDCKDYAEKDVYKRQPLDSVDVFQSGFVVHRNASFYLFHF